MSDLRLGILGLSPGNGHPYSWSAIFNGYEPEAMADCGFPAIPDYLSRQSFPTDAIAGARVTHVWTQDEALSQKVAAAARIPYVAPTPEAMIGHVDAILLARDDAENHFALARPFLAAGLPVYIDKPLALSRAGAEALFALEQRAGQIFSCSALLHAPEMRLSDGQKASLGDIRHVSARVPKSWAKYAIHVIDPILAALGDAAAGPPRDVCLFRPGRPGHDAGALTVSFRFENGPSCTIEALGEVAAPIEVGYFGTAGFCQTSFRDSFTAFRAALEVFLADSVKGHRSHRAVIERAVGIIELGTPT